MAVQMKSETSPKAALSVSAMCRRLAMSRSQFYWHVKRGTFHSPLHMTSNNRPYFTAAMVDDNLNVRETCIAVNGEYVIFYERQTTERKTSEKKGTRDHSPLIDGLKSLGLNAVTREQIESALADCFPSGTSGQDEGAVLRAVFRHLKRAGVV